MLIQRTQVLWLGPPPSKRVIEEFERRRLTISVTREPLSDQNFAVSRAIVFALDETRKGHSIGLIKKYAEQASEHGLLVIVHADKAANERILQGHVPDALVSDSKQDFERFVDFPRPQFSLKRPAHELAELAARHPVGPSFTGPDALKVGGELPEKESDIFFCVERLVIVVLSQCNR